VAELEGKLTAKEYFKWLAYFEEINKTEPDKPNMLDSPDAMIQGFGL
jgi:hypothetical protein